MTVSRDQFMDIVDQALELHFAVDGRYEWVDRTTRTQSFEWQIRPGQSGRPGVGGECYLTFQVEDDETRADLRATMEFRDIDRVKNTELLSRAREYLERADVEYRIVEEFSEGEQSFHVFIGTALFFDEPQLSALETGIADEIDIHLETLAAFAIDVDGMVYVGPPAPGPVA
jgi:hypothetical protein